MKYKLLIFLLAICASLSAQIYHVDPCPSGGGGYIIRSYTTVGSDSTWTKPANLSGITVFAQGGGGGGGAGRRGLSTTNRRGGGGGSGGAFVKTFFPADSLIASYRVHVGGGGQGGQLNTIDNSNGQDGLGGTASGLLNVAASRFIVNATGGNPGLGGTEGTGITGGGAATLLANSRPNILSFAVLLGGSGGGSSSTSSGASGTTGFGAGTGVGGPGGAGGGAISNTGVERSGGTGGPVVNNVLTQVSGGSFGSTTGERNGGNGALTYTAFLTWRTPTVSGVGVGTGGGGGASGVNNGSIPGGNGGNGGPGAGGGGGGASANGGPGGSGGNGGNGWVIIVEHY